MNTLIWIILILFLSSFILLAYESIADGIAILKEKVKKK